MTTPDTLELLRAAAERAKPYWSAVDMMLGGNPIAADIVTPFAQSISPYLYIALLDRLEAAEGRAMKLVHYAVHDDDCTVNRYPEHEACSCGLRLILQETRHAG